MSLIVAARFQTFDEAEGAARALKEIGIMEDALHTFFVNPPGSHDRYPLGGDRAHDPDSAGAPFGAVSAGAVVGLIGAIVGGVLALGFTDSLLPIIAGAGVGAYIGSLIGAVFVLGRKRPRRSLQEARDAKVNQGRASGVMLAVHTSPEQQKAVADILRSKGGVEVERAHGRWEDGKWRDFDPLVTPNLEQQGGQPGSSGVRPRTGSDPL
ncbi:GlsB/YeaQ/YmgE family stress response membrane protein [Parapusillimonas sp. JC17]|uniref:GlsB/YeaQ/YmgE family stress response membrane protein n=1 Tax=Parapusillimonas sp. JC17 TaxID=3445768 RepID=UPI003F9EC309